MPVEDDVKQNSSTPGECEEPAENRAAMKSRSDAPGYLYLTALGRRWLLMSYGGIALSFGGVGEVRGQDTARADLTPPFQEEEPPDFDTGEMMGFSAAVGGGYWLICELTYDPEPDEDLEPLEGEENTCVEEALGLTAIMFLVMLILAAGEDPEDYLPSLPKPVEPFAQTNRRGGLDFGVRVLVP